MGGGASILYPDVENNYTSGRSGPQANENVATSAEHRGDSSCGAYSAETDISTPLSGHSTEPRLRITSEEDYNQGFFVFLQLLQQYEDHRYYYPPGKFSPDEEYANNYSLYGQLLERAMLTSPLVKKHEEVLQSLEYYSQEWGKEKAEKEQMRLEFESLKAKVIGPIQRLKSVEEELQYTKAEYFKVQLEKTEAQERLRLAEEVAAMQVEDIRAACARREMKIYEETLKALKSKDDSVRDLEKGFEDLANRTKTAYESKIAILNAKLTEEQDKVHRKTFWDTRMLVHTEDGSLDNIDIACILCCSQLVLVDECIDAEKLRSFGYHWLLLQVPLVSHSFFPVYSALMALNVLFKFSEILQDVIENGNGSRDVVSRHRVNGEEYEENVVTRPPSSDLCPSLELPRLSTLAGLFSLCEPSSGHALSNKTLRVYMSNLLARIACHPTPRSAWSSGGSGIRAIIYLLTSSQSSLENCIAMMATRNLCFESPTNQLCLAQSKEAVEAVVRASKQEIDEESLFMTGMAATNMLYKCPQAISSFVSHDVPGTLLHRLQVNLLHFSPRVVCSLLGAVISMAFQKNLRQSIAATWANWLVMLLCNARKNVITAVEVHNKVLCNDFQAADSGAAAIHEAGTKTSEARPESLINGAVPREHNKKAHEVSIVERENEGLTHTFEDAHKSSLIIETEISQAVAKACTAKDPSGSKIVAEEIVAGPLPVEQFETGGQSFNRELDEIQESIKPCAAEILPREQYMIPGEILAGVCRLISVLVFESMDNTELFLELGILDCLTDVLKRCGSKRLRGFPSSNSSSRDCSHTEADCSGSANGGQGSGNENTHAGARHDRGDDQALISACGLLSILSLNEKARKYLITSTICTPLIRLYYGTKYSSAVRTGAILALSCLSPTRKEKHYWDQNAVSHDFFVSGAVRVFLEIASQHSDFLKRYPTVKETVMELCPEYLPWKSQSAQEMDGQVDNFLISDSSSESLEVENEVLKRHLERQIRDNPKIPRKDGILEVKLSEEMASLTFMFQDYDNRKVRKTKKDFINIDALSMSIPAGMEFDVMNRNCSEGSTHNLLRRKRREGGDRDTDSSKSLWTWSKWWWE